MKTRLLKLLLLTLLACDMLRPAAHAAVTDWNPGVSGLWSGPNWSAGVPGAPDTAFFPGPGPIHDVDLTPPITIDTMNIDGVLGDGFFFRDLSNLPLSGLSQLSVTTRMVKNGGSRAFFCFSVWRAMLSA